MVWRLVCCIAPVMVAVAISAFTLGSRGALGGPAAGQAVPPRADPTVSEAVRQERQRLLDLLLELKMLQARFGPDHPKILKAREEIEAASRVLENSVSPASNARKLPRLRLAQVEEMGERELRGLVYLLSLEVASLNDRVARLEEPRRYKPSPVPGGRRLP